MDSNLTQSLNSIDSNGTAKNVTSLDKERIGLTSPTFDSQFNPN
jgi:hypothetical protein